MTQYQVHVWLTDAKDERTCEETCRKKFRHQQRGLEMVAQQTNISCQRSTSRESHSKVDFRLQGLSPFGCPKKKNTITSARKHSKQLIHQFETHPNKEALQADLKQNRAFNPFSEQSKEMIYSMEYFKICEITPKLECTNCMTQWTTCLRLFQTKFEN